MRLIVLGLVAVGALVFTATPSFAGSADWYVVLDTASKKCSITDTKPTSGTKKVLLDGKSFPSEEEATAAMKKAPECTAN